MGEVRCGRGTRWERLGVVGELTYIDNIHLFQCLELVPSLSGLPAEN